MYESELVQVADEYNSVEEAWQKAKNLSTDQKAQLVERLLGRQSGLVVVQTNAHLADYIIAQMSLLSLDGLIYVFRALVIRIAEERNRLSK